MLNKLRKLKEKKGFTLVELIVVIAIIAILTAVIVPLVGRYSAQATYTTLQDAAKTVSNSANNVISEITMMGSVYGNKTVEGTKSSTGISFSSSDKAGAAGSAADDTKFQEKLENSLNDAIPNGARFLIEIGLNTVEGVVYTTDATVDLSEAVAAAGNDFTDAYQIGSVAVGAAGNKIPAAAAAAGGDGGDDD